MGFHLVGYGCTTCIGNSGPLPEPVANAIQEGDLVAAAVLSGNRNFEGRIHPSVRANYLASPPLVVAYALAGSMDIDLYKGPLGAIRRVIRFISKTFGRRPKEVQEVMTSRCARRCSRKNTARPPKAMSAGRRCRCRRRAVPVGWSIDLRA